MTDFLTVSTVLATASPDEVKDSTAGSSHPSVEDKDEDHEEEGSKSRMQRWEELPMWAKIGIIGGSVLVGLVSSQRDSYRSSFQLIRFFFLL